VRHNTLTDGHQNDSTWGISPELNWKFDGFQLTYLGSYRKLKRDDGFPFVVGAPFTLAAFFVGDYWQDSQEFRISTTGSGPFEGQAGVYYFKEQSGIALWLPNLLGPELPKFPNGVPLFGFPQDPTISQSKAVFGQGSYRVTDKVKLTAGVRYTKDDKSRLGASARQYTLVYNPVTDRRDLNWAEIHNTKTTWRAGVEYTPTDDWMFYGSIATGYKAGGFGDGCEAGVTGPNGVPCNQVNTKLYYQPENLTAYEAGFKGKAADRLTISAAVFKYDYKDMQLSSVGTVGGAPSLVTQNAGKSEVKGLEIESTYAVNSAHRFDLALTVLDAKYKQYLGGPQGHTNFAGEHLDHSPDSSGTLGYTYRHPLGNGDALSFNLRTKYSASYVLTDYTNGVQFTQPSYSKTDASLTYNAAGNKWYASAYVHNMEDSVQASQIGYFGTWNLFSSEPRTYGVSAGVKF
jgi:iron complex outermembrane receptor protein